MVCDTRGLARGRSGAGDVRSQRASRAFDLHEAVRPHGARVDSGALRGEWGAPAGSYLSGGETMLRASDLVARGGR